MYLSSVTVLVLWIATLSCTACLDTILLIVQEQFSENIYQARWRIPTIMQEAKLSTQRLNYIDLLANNCMLHCCYKGYVNLTWKREKCTVSLQPELSTKWFKFVACRTRNRQSINKPVSSWVVTYFSLSDPSTHLQLSLQTRSFTRRRTAEWSYMPSTL